MTAKSFSDLITIAAAGIRSHWSSVVTPGQTDQFAAAAVEALGNAGQLVSAECPRDAAAGIADRGLMPIEVTYDHDAGRWYVRTTNPDNLRECSDPYEAVEVVREFTLRQREIAIEALRDAPEAPAGPAVR